MDDTQGSDTPETKTYTLPINGVDHEFKPLSADLVARLGVILHMKPSAEIQAEMAFTVLADAALDWDGILRRYTLGEVEPKDIVGVMQDIADLMVKDAKPSDAQ